MPVCNVSKRSSISRKTVNPLLSEPEEGHPPLEFVGRVQGLTTKQRQQTFEALINSIKPNIDSLSENCVIAVPQKKRLKVGVQKPGDREYIPGSYATYDYRDYSLAEAPSTQKGVVDLWRLMWQDGVRLIVCLTPVSDSEPGNPCVAYFPRKEGTTSNYGDMFNVRCEKRSSEKNTSAILYELVARCEAELGKKAPSKEAANDEDVDPATGEKLSKEDEKERKMAVVHLETWKSDEWPDLDDLNYFMALVVKREQQIVSTVTDGYVPPVVIQGSDGSGRGAVVWVALALYRHVKLKDSFDIEEIIRKLAKQRPGVLTRRLHYCLVYALCLRIGGYHGLLTDWKSKVAEIKESLNTKTRRQRNEQSY